MLESLIHFVGKRLGSPVFKYRTRKELRSYSKNIQNYLIWYSNNRQKLDDGIEMTWKVFAGEQSEIFAAFCWIRAKNDGFPMTTEGVANCFRAHLNRGLTFLSSGAKKKKISDLMIDWLDFPAK